MTSQKGPSMDPAKTFIRQGTFIKDEESRIESSDKSIITRRTLNGQSRDLIIPVIKDPSDKGQRDPDELKLDANLNEINKDKISDKELSSKNESNVQNYKNKKDDSYKNIVSDNSNKQIISKPVEKAAQRNEKQTVQKKDINSPTKQSNATIHDKKVVKNETINAKPKCDNNINDKDYNNDKSINANNEGNRDSTSNLKSVRLKSDDQVRINNHSDKKKSEPLNDSKLEKKDPEGKVLNSNDNIDQSDQTLGKVHPVNTTCWQEDSEDKSANKQDNLSGKQKEKKRNSRSADKVQSDQGENEDLNLLNNKEVDKDKSKELNHVSEENQRKVDIKPKDNVSEIAKGDKKDTEVVTESKAPINKQNTQLKQQKTIDNNKQDTDKLNESIENTEDSTLHINRQSTVVSDTVVLAPSTISTGNESGKSRTSSSVSKKSQKAVFSKKDGVPVYLNPDSEGDISDTKQAWSEMPKSKDNLDNTSRGKQLPTVFATPTVHKKKTVETNDENKDNLESVASNFWERINKTESENQKLQEDNDYLRDKLKKAEENERKISDENFLLKSEMTDLTKQYHKAKQEGNELRQKISSINNEHKRFIDRLEAQAEGLKKDIEEGKVEVEKMLEENRRKEQELAKLKADNVIEIARLKSEIEKYQALARGKSDLEKKNAELLSKERMLETIQSKNITEIEKLSNCITKLRGEIEMLKDENKKLKNERDSKVKKEEEISKSVAEMEQLYDKMLKAKLKAEAAQRALETEVELLKKEREFSEWDAERLKQQISDLEKRIDSMKTAEDSLQKLIQDKQVHIEDLQKQIIDLKNVNNRQRKDIEELKDESKSEKVQTSKYDEMQKAHKKLLDENKRLRTQLAHKTIIETNNDSQRDEMQTKLEKTQDQLEEAKERIRKMEGWLDEIYSNRDLGDLTARTSTVSLPDIAQSVISEPTQNSPRVNKQNKKKSHAGFGVSYASKYKNRKK